MSTPLTTSFTTFRDANETTLALLVLLGIGILQGRERYDCDMDN